MQFLFSLLTTYLIIFFVFTFRQQCWYLFLYTKLILSMADQTINDPCTIQNKVNNSLAAESGRSSGSVELALTFLYRKKLLQLIL